MDGFDVSTLFGVEGLVVVVTGGGTGIGLCMFREIAVDIDISSALAQNGAIVYIVGRRKEKLEAAVEMHSVFITE
jgi:NADP-dependent 3-hydroxy acid dehydrogenase YdfG